MTQAELDALVAQAEAQFDAERFSDAQRTIARAREQIDVSSTWELSFSQLDRVAARVELRVAQRANAEVMRRCRSASQSFTAPEVDCLHQLVTGLLRGGDVRVVLRSEAFASVARKVATMRDAIARNRALREASE